MAAPGREWITNGQAPESAGGWLELADNLLRLISRAQNDAVGNPVVVLSWERNCAIGWQLRLSSSSVCLGKRWRRGRVSGPYCPEPVRVRPAVSAVRREEVR